VHLLKLKNAALAVTSFRTFPPTPLFAVDIHPTAVIDPTATICSGARIARDIGPKTIIGDNTTLYPNVTILDECIGENTVIWSGTVVRERCHIGNDCILHPNATIGADGFGFRPDPQRGLKKFHKLVT
jgi:UDP-3-O-[3-hydroxymyristoyl] glucosamine N-acyltransferase